VGSACEALDGELRHDLPDMDQPHRNAALGTQPIRTIGREELKAKLDRGDDFKLIMALNRWAYDAKHIPGSLHFDTPEALYAAVQPDDEVVVYCSNLDCLSSVALYRDLDRRGYRNVRRYSGGLLDWEDAGLPLEGGFAAASGREAAPQEAGR
jgi:rhodanese-related sulfurtransferase